MLQATQAQRWDWSDYGIDYQLLQAAREMSPPVQELKGRSSNYFCDLPDGGMVLLDDTLTHWHTNARLLVMIGWWLSSPPTSVGACPCERLANRRGDVLMQVKRNEARATRCWHCRRDATW